MINLEIWYCQQQKYHATGRKILLQENLGVTRFFLQKMCISCERKEEIKNLLSTEEINSYFLSQTTFLEWGGELCVEKKIDLPQFDKGPMGGLAPVSQQN